MATLIDPFARSNLKAIVRPESTCLPWRGHQCPVVSVQHRASSASYYSRSPFIFVSVRTNAWCSIVFVPKFFQVPRSRAALLRKTRRVLQISSLKVSRSTIDCRRRWGGGLMVLYGPYCSPRMVVPPVFLPKLYAYINPFIGLCTQNTHRVRGFRIFR